ncbi:MAG: hypothetical protein ACI9DJ_002488 [Algoriphagus sp.]
MYIYDNLLAPTKETILKMTYKWNSAEAETYAKAFSKLICDEYFKSQQTISGEEILKITEIKQLNLLVIRNLFEKWQEDSSRLKSPYFDFEQEEVKTALEEFMNILSRFISVRRDKFETLLAQSVKDTLQLCSETKGYFDNLMRNLPEFKLTPEWIATNKKYFQINKSVFEHLETKLNGSTVFANQGIEHLEAIFPNYIADDASEILEDLDGILRLRGSGAGAKKSFFDQAFDQEEPTKKVLQPILEKPEIVARVIQKALEVSPQIRREQAVVIPGPRSLNDRLIGISSTLNDKVVEKSHSLLDAHNKSRISSLKNGVSLNQRFLFINTLFNGDQQLYARCMETLDAFGDLGEAQGYIVNQVAVDHNWNNKSAEAEEFYALVERKFS